MLPAELIVRSAARWLPVTAPLTFVSVTSPAKLRKSTAADVGHVGAPAALETHQQTRRHAERQAAALLILPLER